MDDVRAGLRSTEEQLVLLKETNTMLCDESQKVNVKLFVEGCKLFLYPFSFGWR